MPNSKNLTGALGFLVLIAALDNFIFIEVELGFEQMAFIDSGAAPASEPGIDEPGVSGFWIDKHEVSHADFTGFVESTGYQPQPLAGEYDWSSMGSAAKLGHSLNEDIVSTQQQSKAIPERDSPALVNHEDALAYCNWLGKNLPSDTQVQAVSINSHGSVDPDIELQSLHHGQPPLKTWIGIEQERGLIIDASTYTYGKEHSRSDNDGNLRGFLCVKNVERTTD